MTFPIRPRSVRARLVATYTVVALLLGAAALLVFAALLHRGLYRSLDAGLQVRAAPLVAALADPTNPGLPDLPDSSPVTSPGPQPGVETANPGYDTLAAVYRPDGRIVPMDPASLPASPLSTGQLAQVRSRPAHLAIGTGARTMRILAVPVHRVDGVWVVAVGSNTALTTGAATSTIRDLLLAFPLLVLAAALGAWLLSGAALRPVERLRAEAEDLGAHDPSSRLGVPATADELARLATTFNGLLDSLQRSLSQQRDLVADAGHELRTPLAVLRTELELADRPERSREQLADAVAHARIEVDRLSRLADALLYLARADNRRLVAPEWTDAGALAARVVRASQAEAARRQVRLVAAPSGGTAEAEAETWVDPAALHRVLDNLVDNALTASGPGGTVTVTTRKRGAETLIEVDDVGSGFPPEFLPHAFERFRRADAARSPGSGGAGLGLAIVAEIAHAHGGRAEAANKPEGGAIVRIVLPEGPSPPRPTRLRRLHPTAAAAAPPE